MLIVPGAGAAEKDSYDNLASNVRRKSATRRRRSAQPFNTAESGPSP
jgi:hypothetical protein